MNVQVIKDRNGRPEYVLLPMDVYKALKPEIEAEWIGLKARSGDDEDYVPFRPADYTQNPAALARLTAGVKQKALADMLGVSQAYVSKLENAERVTSATLNRVKEALAQLQNHATRD